MPQLGIGFGGQNIKTGFVAVHPLKLERMIVIMQHHAVFVQQAGGGGEIGDHPPIIIGGFLVCAGAAANADMGAAHDLVIADHARRVVQDALRIGVGQHNVQPVFVRDRPQPLR